MSKLRVRPLGLLLSGIALLVAVILLAISFADHPIQPLKLSKTTSVKQSNGQIIPIGWQSYIQKDPALSLNLPPDLSVLTLNEAKTYPVCLLGYSAKASNVPSGFTSCANNGGLLEHGYVVSAVVYPVGADSGPYGAINYFDMDNGSTLETVNDPRFGGNLLRLTHDGGCARPEVGGNLRYCYERIINFSTKDLHYAISLRAADTLPLDVQNYKNIFDRVVGSLAY